MAVAPRKNGTDSAIQKRSHDTALSMSSVGTKRAVTGMCRISCIDAGIAAAVASTSTNIGVSPRRSRAPKKHRAVPLAPNPSKTILMTRNAK
jgi:hypothetical protein